MHDGPDSDVRLWRKAVVRRISGLIAIRILQLHVSKKQNHVVGLPASRTCSCTRDVLTAKSAFLFGSFYDMY
jgi:hypothetical protein